MKEPKYPEHLAVPSLLRRVRNRGPKIFEFPELSKQSASMPADCGALPNGNALHPGRSWFAAPSARRTPPLARWCIGRMDIAANSGRERHRTKSYRSPGFTCRRVRPKRAEIGNVMNDAAPYDRSVDRDGSAIDD